MMFAVQRVCECLSDTSCLGWVVLGKMLRLNFLLTAGAEMTAVMQSCGFCDPGWIRAAVAVTHIPWPPIFPHSIQSIQVPTRPLATSLRAPMRTNVKRTTLMVNYKHWKTQILYKKKRKTVNTTYIQSSKYQSTSKNTENNTRLIRKFRPCNQQLSLMFL